MAEDWKMGYLKERVAYLKGLAEGMKPEKTSDEAKLMNAILDVLDDFAIAVEHIEESQRQLGHQVDEIDENLADVEDIIYDMDAEEAYNEIECPYCNETIDVSMEMTDGEYDTIECPNCHRDIEFKWDNEGDDADMNS